MAEHKKTKVIVMTADSSIGGGSSHILGLLDNLDASKFFIHLICPKGYLSQEASKLKHVTIFNVSFKNKFDLFSYFGVKEAILKVKLVDYPFSPIILHSHGTRAGLFSLYLRDSLVSKIYTEHLYVREYQLRSKFGDRLQKWLMKKVYNSSSKVICVSSAVRDYLKDLGVSKDKLVVIANGIDAKVLNSKKIKEHAKIPIIGTIGTLNELKGQKYLILAMKKVVKKYPLACLEIIGDGGEKENLKKLIASQGLSKNISLLGSKKEVNDIVKHWDVFALPSLSESFGIVLLEAMKHSLPIVATKVGGVPEVIKNKSNGILVEPGSAEKLAGAIIYILENPVAAAKFKRNGHETLKVYDWKNIIEKIESVYQGN